MKTHKAILPPGSVDALRAQLNRSTPDPDLLATLLNQASRDMGSIQELRHTLDTELWKKLVSRLPVGVVYVVKEFFERTGMLTPQDLLEHAVYAYDAGLSACAADYVREVRLCLSWERIRELIERDYGEQYLALVPSSGD